MPRPVFVGTRRNLVRNLPLTVKELNINDMANISTSDPVERRTIGERPPANSAADPANAPSNGLDETYNEQSIEVLRGLDAVRKR